jgi:hypothetical protein
MASKQLSNPITIRIDDKSISLSPGSFTAESIARALQDGINRDNTSPVVSSNNNGSISIIPVYIGKSQTLFFRNINDANFLGWNSTMVTLPSTAPFPFIGDRPAQIPPPSSSEPAPSPQPYDINKNLSDLKYFTSLGLDPKYNESFKKALNEYKLNNGVEYDLNISERPSNNSQNKEEPSNNSQNKKNNSLNKKNNSQNKKNNSLNKKTKGGLSRKSKKSTRK